LIHQLAAGSNVLPEHNTHPPKDVAGYVPFGAGDARPKEIHNVNPFLKTLRSAMIAIPILLLAMSVQAEAPDDKPFAEHKLVLQISDSDPARQNLVLNVANNAIQHYGPEKIDVEIVAFGPGLSMLFADNPHASRIDGLAVDSGVRFAACENTIAAVTRMRGTAPELNPRATHVEGGVVRIMDLTAAGYTLISP
jgi:uncharacterized protein